MDKSLTLRRFTTGIRHAWLATCDSRRHVRAYASLEAIFLVIFAVLRLRGNYIRSSQDLDMNEFDMMLCVSGER